MKALWDGGGMPVVALLLVGFVGWLRGVSPEWVSVMVQEDARDELAGAGGVAG